MITRVLGRDQSIASHAQRDDRVGELEGGSFEADDGINGAGFAGPQSRASFQGGLESSHSPKRPIRPVYRDPGECPPCDPKHK